jgi:hypothetical protein
VRICEAQIAAQGADVANAHVGQVPLEIGERRDKVANLRGALDFSMRGRRADREPFPRGVVPDPAETRNATQVDEVLE